MNKRFTLYAILLVVLFAALIVAAATLMKSSSDTFTPVHPAPAGTPAHAVSGPAAPIKAPAPDSGGKTGPVVSEKNPVPADTTQAMNGPTPEQRAENAREIARMKKDLPGNMWIPEDPRFGIDPGRADKIRKAIELSDKVNKGTATREEKIEYYQYKIKSTQDRIDIVNYIARRTAELRAQNGKPYLSDQDIETGKKTVAELSRKISGYKDQLTQLKNPSPQ